MLQRRRERERLKSSRFGSLQVQLAFWYISLPSLHDYDVTLPNFSFNRERKNDVVVSKTSVHIVF